MALDTDALRNGINNAVGGLLDAFDFVPYSVSVGALAISAFLLAGRSLQGLRLDGSTAATVVNLGGGMVSAAVIYATTSGLLDSDIEQFGLLQVLGPLAAAGLTAFIAASALTPGESAVAIVADELGNIASPQ